MLCFFSESQLLLKNTVLTGSGTQNKCQDEKDT